MRAQLFILSCSCRVYCFFWPCCGAVIPGEFGHPCLFLLFLTLELTPFSMSHDKLAFPASKGRALPEPSASLPTPSEPKVCPKPSPSSQVPASGQGLCVLVSQGPAPGQLPSVLIPHGSF